MVGPGQQGGHRNLVGANSQSVGKRAQRLAEQMAEICGEMAKRPARGAIGFLGGGGRRGGGGGAPQSVENVMAVGHRTDGDSY